MELVNAHENGETTRCGHKFSMRGYVTEIRKKDSKTCWPFGKVESYKGLEEEVSELPLLHVTEYRWWRCQNCLRRIGVIDSTSETGEIGNDSNNVLEPVSHSNENSLTAYHGDAPMRLSGLPKASTENICEQRKDNACSIVDANKDGNINLSLGNDMEKMEILTPNPTTEDLYPSQGQCDKDGLEDNVNHTILETICAARVDKPCPTKEVPNCLGETPISFNQIKYGCDVSVPETDASTKSVSPCETSQGRVAEDGADENVIQTVGETIYGPTNHKPCLPKGVANGFDERAISFNNKKQGCDLSAPESDTSGKFVSPFEMSPGEGDGDVADKKVNQIVRKTVSAATNDKPCLPEGLINGVDETVIHFTDKQGCDIFTSKTDASSAKSISLRETFQGRGDKHGAEENVKQTVQETICTVTGSKQCITQGVRNGFDELIILSKRHGCNVSTPEVDVSPKSVFPYEDGLETASLKPKSKKRKLKRVTGSSEMYFDETPGFGKKDAFKMKKRLRKETSDGWRSTVNMDIDESDEEFSKNNHVSSGRTPHRRKVRKVRTLKEILESEASFVHSRGFGSEDPNTKQTKTEAAIVKQVRKEILGIDLNCYPDSPVAVQGNGETTSLGKKGKRKVFNEDHVSLHTHQEMFTLGKKKSKLPSDEDRRSAFVPWKDGSGLRIGRDCVQSSGPQVVVGNYMDLVEGWSSQFHQPEASSHPSVSANGMSEPAALDEMEVAGLMARNQHERHLSYAEGAKGKSTDGIVFQPSVGFPTLSLSLPNCTPLGSNNPQTYVGGSSTVNSLSHHLQLPSDLLMHRARECDYHRQPIGKLDLLSNDVIPATQLLRLMDAGVCTNSSANADKTEFTKQSLLSHEHLLPQSPRLEFGQSMNLEASTCPPSWGFFNSIPGGPSFSYLSQRRDSGLTKLMAGAFKSQVKETAKGKKPVPAHSGNSRLQKCVSRSSTVMPQKGKRFPFVSAPMPFPSQSRAICSTAHDVLGLHQTDGTAFCTVNRNPADFSLPEAGNVYMIGYKELKRKKTVSSGEKRARKAKPLNAQQQSRN